MQRHTLLAGTAIALVMCAVPALAQQKAEDKAGSAQTQGETKEQGSPQKGTSQRKAEPKNEQGAAQSNGKEKGAQTKQQSKEKDAQNKEPSKEKGAQNKEQSKEKGAQTQEKSGKGTAQAPTKEQDKKGSAQTAPREKDGKGTAQAPSKDKGTAQAPGKEQEKMGSGQAQSKDRNGKEMQKSSERSRSGERVQLSEQQRTNVHQTLLKESNLNRATNLNISISVGTRIPRSVRLVALPASIISVVPAYRSYQYVVVNDEICIVDPNSYEIVEVIAAPGQSARVDSRGGQSALVLTEEEKAIVLRSIDMDRNSTLGLGTLTEGSSVPRGANVQVFSDTVVQQVPKLKGHKFFAAENRVAIVDTQGDKVQLVLEGKH
jgi:Protein of unknown function (DUF1236)